MRLPLACFVLFATGSVGCTLARGALTPASDAGGTPVDDAFALDAPATIDDAWAPGVDAWTPDLDAFVAPDARGCSGDRLRCEGNVAVTCVEGEVVRTTCMAPTGDCEEGSCVDLCAVGETRCSGTSQDACDSLGHWVPAATCPLGCDGDHCRAVPECTAFDSYGSITLGDLPQLVALCGGTDRAAGPTGDCDDADGRERMLTLDIVTAGNYVLDVRDADTGVVIDTVLYLRTDCGDRNSQIACDDDEPCDASDGVGDPCTDSGNQWGHSRIVVALTPGRYFVMVDSIDRPGGGGGMFCGNVRIFASPI